MTQCYYIVRCDKNDLTPDTLERLCAFLVSHKAELQGQRLSFAWRDKEDNEFLIESDSDLREAIQKQTSRPGSSALRFFVTADESQSVQSLSSASMRALVEEKVQKCSQNGSSPENKPLAELSVEDVVALFEKLDMPEDFISVTRRKKISGAVLCFVESIEDLTDKRLTDDTLSKVHAKMLLQKVLDMQKNGVGAYLLCSSEVARQNVIAQTPSIPTASYNASLSPAAVSLPSRETPHLSSSSTCAAAAATEAPVPAPPPTDDDDRFAPIVRRWRDEAAQKKRSPLALAVEEGDETAVRALLECFCDLVPNEQGEEKHRTGQTKQELLNKREFKNQRTALHVAAEKGNTEIVSLLIAHNANIWAEDQDQRTPLLVAALSGHTTTVSHLISWKANVEEKDKYKSTSLHYAADNGNTEMVSLLIEQKAYINSMDGDLNTPLHFAAMKGHTNIVSLLLSHGAIINAKENSFPYYQATPLHIAAHNGRTETVSVLISHKANIEAKDKWQRTPLYIASEKGHTETVSLLIEQKANIEAKDRNGKTPFDCTRTEAIKALISDAREKAPSEVCVE